MSSLRLGLGTAQFGLNYGVANNYQKVPLHVAVGIVSASLSQGIRIFDTAVAYGDSERLLGSILTEQPTTLGRKVVSKILVPNKIPANFSDWLEREVTAATKRLGLDHLYGLLMHSCDDFNRLPAPIIATALQSLKEKGLVEKVGVSIYAPDELHIPFSTMDLDIIQAPMSLLDRRLEQSGWLQKLSNLNIELHARSVFLQGLLLSPRNTIPKKFEKWGSLWDALEQSIHDLQMTRMTAALSYPLSFSSVSAVIVGANSTRQLEEIFNGYERACDVCHPLQELKHLVSDDLNLIEPYRW